LFVNIPQLVPGPRNAGGALLLVRTGSLAGYTRIMGMLPECNGAFIFATTNAIGLSYASGWALQLLVETMFQNESRTDYAALAKEAAMNHTRREIDNANALDNVRTHHAALGITR
jgi:hypothetical protein